MADVHCLVAAVANNPGKCHILMQDQRKYKIVVSLIEERRRGKKNERCKKGNDHRSAVDMSHVLAETPTTYLIVGWSLVYRAST